MTEREKELCKMVESAITTLKIGLKDREMMMSLFDMQAKAVERGKKHFGETDDIRYNFQMRIDTLESQLKKIAS